MENNSELTGKIIGLAMNLHSALGPGLLESVYRECLYYDLLEAGFVVEREKPLPLIYKNVKMDCGYRVDLFVESTVVIEIKSIDILAPVHTAQILTYLRLSNKRLGLLINFNVAHLKEGIRRIVNGY